MMGKHNPDLQRGLESVFECKHLDWTETKFTEPYQPELAHQEPVMQRIRHAHGFDVRNPSGESRERENTISASTPISKKNLFDEVVLKALNEVGYAALFSTGVDETIKVIESYINQE